MFNIKVGCGGGLIVSYDGLDVNEEVYCHPFYGDNYVWSCECHEINELFHCDDEVFLYPVDNEVLELLDSAGVLSDLGLSYISYGVFAI